MVVRFGWVGLLFALVVLVLLCSPGASIAADSWQGKVVQVINGATLDIAKPDGQVERVKLYAIRVPPPGQPGGDNATNRTASWCHQWGDVAEVIPVCQSGTVKCYPGSMIETT